MKENTVAPEVKNTDRVTCKGCQSLSGDILKDEDKKKIFIKLHCLSKTKAGDKAVFLLKTFEVAGLSMENGKLPKYEEYPDACSEHSLFKHVEEETEKNKRKMELLSEDNDEDVVDEDFEE